MSTAPCTVTNADEALLAGANSSLYIASYTTGGPLSMKEASSGEITRSTWSHGGSHSSAARHFAMHALPGDVLFVVSQSAVSPPMMYE